MVPRSFHILAVRETQRLWPVDRLQIQSSSASERNLIIEEHVVQGVGSLLKPRFEQQTGACPSGRFC